MDKAIGFLEVQGFSIALAAMDEACKTASIRIEGIECNNPKAGDKAPIPVMIQVKFTGTISDVRTALEAAKSKASSLIGEQDILAHMIPQSMAELDKLLSIGKVKQKGKKGED